MTHTLHKSLFSNRQPVLNEIRNGLLTRTSFGVSRILSRGVQKKPGDEDCGKVCVQCPRKKVVRRRPPPCPPKPCPKIRYACPITDPPDHCPYKPPPCPPKCDNKPKKKRLPPANVC